MSIDELSKGGQNGVLPGRDALPGVAAGVLPEVRERREGRRRRRGGEALMAEPAEFTSYYGRPILAEPVWEAPAIAGYFFLGGLAGASSAVGAGAAATGRDQLHRASSVLALGAITASAGLLVKDLGRPERFAMMLRVLKPTSPMSVGSWLLTAYAPLAALAAGSAVTGRLPRAGRRAGLGAAALGSGVAAYTAVLAADTAVPAWHDGYRQLPFVFVGSAAAAAGGFGMLAAPLAESGPACRAAVLGAAVELGADAVMQRRLGLVAEAYESGAAGRLHRLARTCTAAGAAGAAVSTLPLGRSRRAVGGGRLARVLRALSGLSLLLGSALTRFAVFEAGRASTKDPRYVVQPQRERMRAREAEPSAS